MNSFLQFMLESFKEGSKWRTAAYLTGGALGVYLILGPVVPAIEITIIKAASQYMIDNCPEMIGEERVAKLENRINKLLALDYDPRLFNPLPFNKAYIKEIKLLQHDSNLLDACE